MGKVVCTVRWGVGVRVARVVGLTGARRGVVRRGVEIDIKTVENRQAKGDGRGGAGEGRYQNSQEGVTPATAQSKNLVYSPPLSSCGPHSFRTKSFPPNSPLFSFTSPLRWAPPSPRCSTPPPPVASTVRAPLP